MSARLNIYIKKWAVEHLWNLWICFVDPENPKEHTLICSEVLESTVGTSGEESGGGVCGFSKPFTIYLVNSEWTWSQIACQSFSFPTFKMRWLIRSGPNSKPNGNIITLHAAWFSLEKKIERFYIVHREDYFLPELLFTALHDDQRHHRVAGDSPGPAGTRPVRAGAPSGVTKTAGWVVGLYFPFVLTDKNELLHTPYSTWEVLRNVTLEWL